MKQPFSYFLEYIPQDIYSKTKSYSCKNIAIFEPEEYVLGQNLQFDDYHFVLFFSNSPITQINGCEYQFKKGSLAVIQPWEVVYVVPNENFKQSKYVSIAVKTTFFEKIALQAAGKESFKFNQTSNIYSKQLLDLIGIFQRELMDHGESYPLMLEGIAIQLVFQLIRDLNANPAPNRSRIGKENEYINKAIQLMQECYNTNISINDICNLIYLSPCHFKRVFKEYTGQTPYQYLLNIRMEKAKEVLRKNENSIDDVARQCGYVNSGHFSMAFKRNMKVSPSEYRKING